MPDDDAASNALTPKHDWLSRLGVSNLPGGGASNDGAQDIAAAPVNSASGSMISRPPAEFYDMGYKTGRKGAFGQCPADADEAGMAAYDEGYAAGQKDKRAENGGPPPPTIDAPKPGQDLHHRTIYVLSDDRVGTVPKDFLGTEAELDEIANAATPPDR
jgi:hypothetical protein